VPGDDVTIEVNGCEADQAAVSLLEHEGWGHFTAMQVRGWAPVGRIDDLVIPQDEAFAGVIAAAIESWPWDEI
jgi:hypothetical protein